MQLLTGNQIGSLLAWYRCMSAIELGIITPQNIDHAVMVKTFVTSPLQDAIAASFGIATVNVLTGFKYIAAKLGKYEQAIPAGLRQGYRAMTEEQTRRLREKLSKVTGKEVLLHCRVEPGTLGGVRLDYDGRRLDDTVASRLQSIRDLLKKTVR